MRFALLGDDPVGLPLVRGIARAPQHELFAAAYAGGIWPQVTELAPRARPLADFQGLLVEPELAAVIVAGCSPDVLEAARALARAGVTLIIFPDIRQTAGFAYDLWPIEDEGRVRLIPVFRHDVTGDADRLRSQLSAAGQLRFLQLERTFPGKVGGRLSRTTAENSLLHDADLLQRLCGGYSRVTCVPVGLTATDIAQMTVTFSGDDLPESTWRLSSGDAAATLTLTGPNDAFKYELAAPSDFSDAESRLVQFIEQELTAKNSRTRWSDVVRAFDIVDAANRSIRRSRTIAIGSEEISEVRQFKSLMTAAGCGVLVYTLLAVIAALLFGALGDPRDAAQRRADAAGFILYAEEFADGGMLTPEGRTHVAEIAPKLWQTTADVIIESTGESADPTLEQACRTSVEQALHADNAARVAGRVVTRPLAGQWFERLMVGVWVVVFAPLIVLLATQFLGLAAQPPGVRSSRNTE
ncbi:MAG: hypothetical protein JNG89_12775 [Planctomycetaceae bacterium]|nr:hypothetical protein [Planctomycetaceae bacterium]